MFTEYDKKQILLEAFDTVLLEYDTCHYQLTYAIALMFKLDLNLALQMWEKVLKNYSKQIKELDYSDILCERILTFALQTTPLDVISEEIITNENMKTVLFGSNSYMGRSTAKVMTYFVKTRQFDNAEELFSLAFSNPLLKDFNRKEIMYFIIQGLNYEDWEASEEFIYKTIKDLCLDKIQSSELDFDFIGYALYKKNLQRANESPLTKGLVEKIRNKNFTQADEIFKELVSSKKFEIDSVLYRVIQTIKITDWMNCDIYVYDLLKRSGLAIYSDKLQNAINKKEKLKVNRINKQKK